MHLFFIFWTFSLSKFDIKMLAGLREEFGLFFGHSATDRRSSTTNQGETLCAWNAFQSER